MLATSFTRQGFFAAIQRLFMLSSGGTVPTFDEAEALFVRSTGIDSPGLLRLSDFNRLCELGSSIDASNADMKEEMKPPAAVEYIGRHCKSVLMSLEKKTMTARHNSHATAFGMHEAIGQSAEGYTTMAQLRQILSKPHPAHTRRHLHSHRREIASQAVASDGAATARPGLVVSEKDWQELELLADPKRTGVFDYEAFVRCVLQTCSAHVGHVGVATCVPSRDELRAITMLLVRRRCQLRVLACDARHQNSGNGERHRRSAESLRPRVRPPTEREATRIWGSARSSAHAGITVL